MCPCRRCRHPATGSTGEQSLPYEERLGDLLHGLTLLPHRDRECGQADRTAAEELEQGFEHSTVQAVEAARIHLVHGESRRGDVLRDEAVGLDLRVVAD